MAKIKSTVVAKPGKKEMRQQVENLLIKLVSEMLNGGEISKHLHKKVKKAGKLLVEGLSETTKVLSKSTKPSKKSAPKKSAPKKAAKKAIPK